jgi:hypothetical protein
MAKLHTIYKAKMSLIDSHNHSPYQHLTKYSRLQTGTGWCTTGGSWWLHILYEFLTLPDGGRWVLTWFQKYWVWPLIGGIWPSPLWPLSSWVPKFFNHPLNIRFNYCFKYSNVCLSYNNKVLMSAGYNGIAMPRANLGLDALLRLIMGALKPTNTEIT